MASAHRLLVSLTSGPVPGEARSRRPGCRSHFGCPRWSCGSHLACAVPGAARAGRGSRGVCSARSSVALPARQPSQDRASEDSDEHSIGARRDRDGPAQAVGHDRGDGRRRDRPRRRPVRHRPCRLRGDASVCARSGRTGSGRSRAAAASAATSRCGCSPTASRSSTCRRSCRPGRGSSPPARAARPTPPTPTPSRWSAPGWPGCVRWSTTSSSRCCGSWSTGAARWARTTPGWSPSCTSCCSS